MEENATVDAGLYLKQRDIDGQDLSCICSMEMLLLLRRCCRVKKALVVHAINCLSARSEFPIKNTNRSKLGMNLQCNKVGHAEDLDCSGRSNDA